MKNNRQQQRKAKKPKNNVVEFPTNRQPKLPKFSQPQQAAKIYQFQTASQRMEQAQKTLSESAQFLAFFEDLKQSVKGSDLKVVYTSAREYFVVVDNARKVGNVLLTSLNGELGICAGDEELEKGEKVQAVIVCGIFASDSADYDLRAGAVAWYDRNDRAFNLNDKYGKTEVKNAS
jgi:hypothetical protein